MSTIESASEQQSQASMAMIGELWALLIRRAVAEGRAYVDEAGVAHLVDVSRPLMVEWAHPSPLIQPERKARHAAS